MVSALNAVVEVRAKQRSCDPCSEQRLRESQRMEAVGRMVSGVSHDFNNLLTGIVLCSDLILAGLEKDNRLRRYAQEIRAAGAQGAELIQQLLAVARERAVEARVLRFNDVILDTRDLLVRLIGENLKLVTELATDLGAVKMDPAQARQIVLNLVLNARDAMPDGGRVTLTTRNGNDPVMSVEGRRSTGSSWIDFEVCDTGCGMDADRRSRVFEPFFTTKKPGKGSGLGLTTVQDIVRQSGGSIEVESEPGKGTRVIVHLPRVEAETKPGKTRSPANRLGLSAGQRVEIPRRGKHL